MRSRRSRSNDRAGGTKGPDPGRLGVAVPWSGGGAGNLDEGNAEQHAGALMAVEPHAVRAAVL